MREKILIDALEDDLNFILANSMNIHIVEQKAKKALKALSDYASAPKEGLRWVKASERMPVKSAVFFRLTHERQDERFFVSWEGFKSQLIIGLDKIEWLDESPSSAPESGGEQDDDFKWLEVAKEIADWQYNMDIYSQRFISLLKSKFILKTTPPTKESGGDDVPNKSNSDVMPVASHSSNSPNSIEQEKEPFERGQDYIQSEQLPKAEKLFEDNGLRLELTCEACPEQYDVFKQVGYLRLRHGEFRVDFPDCGGVTIYEAEPKGDGIFEGGERMKYMTEAMNAILKKLNSEQEDKRSVASKADSSNDAGNQNGLTDK